MSNIELIGSYWTLACGALPPDADNSGRPQWCPHDFKERVEAAAKAGFTGMGFWHSDLFHLAETYSFAEMKKILDGNGIVNIEVEFLLDWFLDGERKKESDRVKVFLMDAAEGLNARHIKIGDFSNEVCPMDKLIEDFAGICVEAKERGTKILYEILPAPFAQINTLDEALALTRGAGMDNGGLMFDIWHAVRNKTSNEELKEKLRPTDLIAAELNDGFLAPPEDLFDATVNHRLLPGEGEFDIKGLVDALKSANYHGPYGVEVISAKLREMPLQEVATETYIKTMAALK